MVILNKKIVSLTVGEKFKLSANVPVTWSSNNENITVNSEGVVQASSDFLYPDGYGIITATAKDTNEGYATCKVTIVNWEANKTNLKLSKKISFGVDGVASIENVDNILYCAISTNLYKSSDSFESYLKIATLPGWAVNMKYTPIGWVLLTTNGTGDASDIWYSKNLSSWEKLFTIYGRPLRHGFECYYNETIGTLSVFAGEYSVDYDHRHKVHRCIINADGTKSYKVVREYYSRNEVKADELKVAPNGCLHIHTVVADKKTGDIYIGVGDNNNECSIVRSTDNGETWKALGVNSQNWRMLSMWFTDDYIYWNMDTHVQQSIWRIKRTNLEQQSIENDLKEKVVDLFQGAMWYHCLAKTPDGDEVVIMAQTAEGELRDLNNRVFGIRELTNGNVEVKELLVLESYQPDVYVQFAQLEPLLQDNNGYLYFHQRQTEYLTTPVRMEWEIQKTPIEDIKKTFKLKASSSISVGKSKLLLCN